MEAICRLCGKHSVLRKSHIIPSFVYRWLKNSSATGYIRIGMTLNKRVQDGEKKKLLCDYCEQLFSQFEKEFSENIFNPMNNGKAVKFFYGAWLLKFAVSVSWKVLTLFKEEGLSHFPPHHLQAADHALEIWKKFLLGNLPHPKEHEQHMLFLGAVVDRPFKNMPTNINRYFLRAVDLDVICTDRTALVISKMCSILLFGFVNVPPGHGWKGTKLHVKHGQIGSEKYTLPLSFGNYLFDRARKCHGFYEKISKKQAERIGKDYRKDLERAARSETWKAMEHDVTLFGDRAFSDSDGK